MTKPRRRCSLGGDGGSATQASTLHKLLTQAHRATQPPSCVYNGLNSKSAFSLFTNMTFVNLQGCVVSYYRPGTRKLEEHEHVFLLWICVQPLSGFHVLIQFYLLSFINAEQTRAGTQFDCWSKLHPFPISITATNVQYVLQIVSYKYVDSFEEKIL